MVRQPPLLGKSDMRKRLVLAVLLAAAMLGEGLVLPNAARAADEPDPISDPTTTADLNPRQMLDFSTETGEEIEAGVREVFKAIAQAQKDKDAILLACLNEKLTGLKTLLNVAQDSDVALRDALARENLDAAEHEIQKLVLAREQAHLLIAEADACMPSAGTSSTGSGRWTATTPGEGEDEDLYDYEPEDFVQPPDVSPFT